MSTTTKAAARAAGTGRYKPYPAYKDSGVEWLGEIPAGWEAKRIKFIAQVGNGSTPHRENAEY